MRLYILIFLLFLTSCSTSKVQNIVSFTSKIKVQSPNSKISLSKMEKFKGDKLNHIHLSLNNISVKDYKKASISSEIVAKPLLVEGILYVICKDGSVKALDTNSHKILWKTHLLDKKTKESLYDGGIAHKEGKLYIANGSQNLHVINAKSGRKITSKKFTDILDKQPVIKDDKILVLSMGNQLFALDITTLTFLWDHAGANESLTYGAKNSSIVIDDQGRVLVGYSSGQLHLLKLEDGEPIWQYDLSLDQNMPGLLPVNIVDMPILEKDFLYVADSTGKIYKFDLKEKKSLWVKDIADIQSFNKVGNAIFVTTNGRQAAAIDAESGKAIWVTDIMDIKNILAYEAKMRIYNEAKSREAIPQTSNVTSKNPFKKLFGKASHLSSKPELKKPILYDRAKAKPINFVKALMVNDMYQLYTATGTIFYLLPKNGQIIDQKDLKFNIDYVIVSDDIILSNSKKILLRK